MFPFLLSNNTCCQDGGEKIYESWDCPSVQIQCDHYPQSEGELEVQCGEIARVLRKSDEGM